MTKKDKSFLILHEKNIFKSILLLALPIMFSNVLKSVHDIVDMYFVSNCDKPADTVNAMVSAITVTNPIIMIFQALAIGLMIAGTAIMSQYIGATRFDKAKKTSSQLLILCIVLGIVFNLVLFFTTEPILKLMGATDKPEVLKYAKQYVQIRSFEMTGLFMFYAYQATRQSMGDTVSPVILNVFSILINIVLTSVMVENFYVAGAAIATVIGNMLIIPICLILMFKTKQKNMQLSIKDLKPNGHYIKKLFSLGTPAALSQAFTSVGFLIINSLILGFDEYIISGIGIGNRINSILLFPAMAVGTVLATFVGQNIGARNVKRAKKCVGVAMVIALLITTIGSTILMFFREQLAGIFIEDDPKAIDSCVKYLYFLLVGLPLMGTFQIFVGAFQGAGRTDFSLFLSALRLWVLRIPVIMLYMYVFEIGEASIWYAMVISNFGATVIGAILYAFVDFKPRLTTMKKNLMKQLEGEKEDGNRCEAIS